MLSVQCVRKSHKYYVLYTKFILIIHAFFDRKILSNCRDLIYSNYYLL